MDSRISQENNELSVDFLQIAKTLFQSKYKIIFTSILFALAFVVIGTIFGKYKSTGYFQFEITLPDYKKLESAMVAPGRWDDFIDETQKKYAPIITKNPFNDEKLEKNFISPIYPITKTEVKDLPDSAIKDAPSGISGLKITYAAATPNIAQEGVRLIANFLRDTIILIRYKELINNLYTDHLNNQLKLKNQLIDINYNLGQLKMRRDDMLKIFKDYPDATKSESRQIVSVTDESIRYLSPITQLVALESTIADQKLKVPKLEREERINSLNLRYYQKMLNLLDKSKSGLAFIKNSEPLLDELQLNLSDDLESSVHNTLSLTVSSAQSTYFKKMRFIAPPTLPTSRSPSLLLMGFLGLIVGTIGACAFILINTKNKKIFFNNSSPEFAT